MNKKRIISFMSAITIVATSFTTGIIQVSADTVNYGVLPAIIDDTETPEVDSLAENYTVSANNDNEDGVVDVVVTATNLKKHTAGNSYGEGYWIGFALTPPEETGINKVKITFGDHVDELMELEPNVDGNGGSGIAFYANAGAAEPNLAAKAQWYINDEPQGDPVEYLMDITNVTLDIEYEPIITAATSADFGNEERVIYADAPVATAGDADENGVIPVTIIATNLEMHLSNGNGEGYWTGFAVEAPANADQAKITFAEHHEELVELEQIPEGKTGINFYTNAAEPDEDVVLQWFDGSEALSNPVKFNMNLDGVTLAKTTADDISAAVLRDTAGIVADDDIADTHNAEVLAETEYEVAVTTTGLQRHKNDDGEGNIGYWTGFAVKAPSGVDGMKVAFVRADEDVDEAFDIAGLESLEENVCEDADGVAFYADASEVKPKTKAILQWFDGSDPASEKIYFVMHLDATLAFEDEYAVLPENIIPAVLYDHGGMRDTLCTEYNVVPAFEEDGTISIDIDMTDLAEHKNNQNTMGHWTGFAIKDTIEASKMKAEYLDENGEIIREYYGALEHNINGNGADGVAFYFNASDENTPSGCALQWFDEHDKALTNKITFNVNIDDVKYDWIKDSSISEATLHDASEELEQVCESHSVNTSQIDDTITVIPVTKELVAHMNGNGPSSYSGHWTGFKVEVPDAIDGNTVKYLRYKFGASTDASYHVEDVSDDEYVPFYVDASSKDAKIYAAIQWLDESENPLSTETNILVDLTEVTFADMSYIDASAVTEANIVDQANPDVQPYRTYSATGATEEDGTIKVNVAMTELKAHLNYNGDESKVSYWTGFGVDCGEAAYVKYAFEADKESLVLGDSVAIGEVAVDGVILFYTEANAPKKYVALQLFDGEGVALTNVTFFEMNLDNVRLYTPPVTGGGGGGVTTYTVTFNTNGGSSVSSARVQKDGVATEPKAPVKEGYTFDGWFTDKELTQKYDFSEKVTKSFTLYAKWVENKKDEEDKNTGLGFGDVSEDAWYYNDVKTIVEAGLMNGVSEDEFSPDSELTRAMFVTILYRAEGEPEVGGGLAFTDVPADAYYANAVKWAVASGIVTGITETEFAPDSSITREQMSVILYRYAKSKNESVSQSEYSYTDSDLVSDYAKEAVAWAAAEKIMNGYEDGSFGPLDTATRAQVAAVFVRYLGL